MARVPGNLPVPITTFVGRAAELAETGLLLGDRRLLSLAGPGGGGKTRLAVRLAGDVADRHPDGVWFVSLAPLVDGGLVAAALAVAVGVGEVPGQPLLDAVVDHLSRRQALIVLDNCEHLLDACVEVAERLLTGCPGVRVLATSREPLGASGETIYRVPSLGMPADDQDAECESVMLFADRMALCRPTDPVGPAEVAAMAAICTRLDGMPLAIELAAARCGTLSPAQVAERLDSHFGLLTGGSRSAQPRQRALEASIDWSYQLLSDDERLLLRRLSVFAGGFTLEAAESVVAGEPLESAMVARRLGGLVDKSLVQETATPGGRRYRLLETVRQFAAGLASPAEAGDVRRRHADYYTAWAEAMEDGLYGPDMTAVRQAVESEIDNLRAADDWATEAGEADLALRLLAALRVFWPMHHLGEGDQRISRALALPGGSPARRGEALHAAIECSCHLGDLDRLEAQVAEGLALAADHPNPELYAELMACAAWARFFAGDESGAALAAESAGLLRECASPRARYYLADVLWINTFIAIARGLAPQAVGHASEAVTRSRGTRNPLSLGRSLIVLAMAHGLGGDLDEAIRAVAEAQPILAGTDDIFLSLADVTAAWIAGTRGDHAGALAAGQVAAVRARTRQEIFSLAMGGSFLLAVVEARAGVDSAVPDSLDEAEALMAGTGVTWGAAYSRALRADVLLAAGDPAGARAAAEAALVLAEASPSGSRSRGPAELARARVARAEGDTGTAEAQAQRALSLLAAAGMRLELVDALELLAAVALDQGRSAEAARLLAAAGTARTDLGYAPWPADAARLGVDIERARDALAADVFNATWEKGAATPLAEAVASASRGRATRRRPTTGWDSLTPTELEVTGLVAEGLRNPEIAAKLFVSPETVKTHVSNILAKLGVANRTELAALATRHR